MNNLFAKALILVALLVYVVSPIDAFPGPIDDAIVVLVGLAATKSRGAIKG